MHERISHHKQIRFTNLKFYLQITPKTTIEYYTILFYTINKVDIFIQDLFSFCQDLFNSMTLYSLGIEIFITVCGIWFLLDGGMLLLV